MSGINEDRNIDQIPNEFSGITQFSQENLKIFMKQIESGKHLEEVFVIELLKQVQELFSYEPNIISLSGPVHIVGDIHGQLYDLLSIFKNHGRPSQDNIYVFLGDYVDRGHFSLETFLYLSILKLMNPYFIFLLRGNHESREINSVYGLLDNCSMIYRTNIVFDSINEVFNNLPIAAWIPGVCFCIHGCVSPRSPLIENYAMIDRFCTIDKSELLSDVTWSDPTIDDKDYILNPRGSGFLIGINVINDFCEMNNIKFIIRSHQLQMQGFQSLFNDRLFTVWSAPNYMYQMGNKASIITVEKNGHYQVSFFDKVPESDKKPENEIPTKYFA